MEHLGGVLLEFALMNGDELILVHLLGPMRGGGETRADLVVELGPGNLAVLVAVEFAEQPVGQLVAVKQTLHGTIRRHRSIHMGEGKGGAADNDGGAQKQGDLGVPGHVGVSKSVVAVNASGFARLYRNKT